MYWVKIITFTACFFIVKTYVLVDFIYWVKIITLPGRFLCKSYSIPRAHKEKRACNKWAGGVC